MSYYSNLNLPRKDLKHIFGAGVKDNGKTDSIHDIEQHKNNKEDKILC